MNNPRELMRDIEHNNLESGEDILTPRDLWYQLCEMVEKQEEELDRFKNGFQGSCYACETVGTKNQELRARIARLAHHLRQAHTFIESTEAFGNAASDGVLQAGNDKATAWNVDESKAALNESEPQSAAALKAEAKRKCPKCGEHSAMVRERHPDTDMNHMALACLDCGFEKEL